MSRSISTVVYAASGCCGRYDQLRRRAGVFEARSIRLFTHGDPQRTPWEAIDDYGAARIVRNADEAVPESWRTALEV